MQTVDNGLLKSEPFFIYSLLNCQNKKACVPCLNINPCWLDDEITVFKDLDGFSVFRYSDDI